MSVTPKDETGQALLEEYTDTNEHDCVELEVTDIAENMLATAEDAQQVDEDDIASVVEDTTNHSEADFVVLGANPNTKTTRPTTPNKAEGQHADGHPNDSSVVQDISHQIGAGLPGVGVADSLWPILESFKGVTLLNGSYYFQGVASPEEIIRAASIARSIVRFTLTDNPETTKQSIQTGTIIRLVQLLSPVMQGPLFPNLTHLRVDGCGASSADQLNLFLTPSLKQLNATNIPDDRQDVLSVFLDTLAMIAKDMEHLALRGLTQTRQLLACSNFERLLHLEIDGSVHISSQFLADVGRLPSLKSFHLGTTTSGTPVGSKLDSASNAVDMISFLHLLKLHVIASPEVVKSLLGMVSSRLLSDLSLTFLWPEAAAGKPIVVRKRIRVAFLSNVPLILESALQKWRETLKAVAISIENAGEGSSPVPMVLAPTTLSLLMDLNLQRLKISQWTIHYSSDIVGNLLTAKWARLEALSLPNGNNTFVTPSRLIEIAERFPALVELHCALNFQELSNESQPLGLPANALTHPLNFFTFWTTAPVEAAKLPNLARFIDYLFPNLQKLEIMSNTDWLDGNQLKALLQLCQAVRKDDASRKPAGANAVRE
ncbi:hypothetical protein D9613_010801 [Agrocybe pediades]|uniref:Uncharacterized protein n=1 Tax=Agrocybe pediades TaxID=84607 RepID=A0A8H4QLY9_9AGAR|nr:hypothetical protein D9613_010801 [Agrocybe pediades]